MVISFEKRRSQIKTVADIDTQLTRAKKYAMGFRTQAKNAGSLAEKLAITEKQKEAEKVLRQLRLTCWDIEDEIIAQEQGVIV